MTTPKLVDPSPVGPETVDAEATPLPASPAPAPAAPAPTRHAGPRPGRETGGHAPAPLAETAGQLAAREHQLALAARLSERALAGASADELAAVVTAGLEAVYPGSSCGISELVEGGGRYRVVSATGRLAPMTGKVHAREVDPVSQSNFSLSSVHAVLVEDLATETRFRPAKVLIEAGLRSSITCMLPGAHAAWGIVSVLAPEPRRFGPADAAFLESVAQILSSALIRRQVEADLDARLRQQKAVARLGQEALRGTLPELLAATCRVVAETMNAEFSKVMELDRDGRLLILRAGHGWRDGYVGQATARADGQSQAGFTLRSDKPVISDDLQRETRFEPAPILLEHGVVSGISTVIRGHQEPYGVLGVHSLQRRAFTTEDLGFLESIAALLGAAVERHRGQEELRRHRAHLEEEVAERTRQLAASNKELEAFSYSVSHDLRAPLRTITGYSTLLSARHQATMPAESLQLLEAIHKNAIRLGHLIDDLLDLSRVQQVDLVRERVDLSALCQNAVANLAAAEPERRVAVTIQPGMVADGDARLLGMLVENLVGNAWKFTRKTEDASILVSRYGTNGSTVYSVKDNGAGFDMAYAARLFQPFHRLHRTSEFEGTGVGLATVKRIIERHGGRIWAEGRVDEGATFYFTLASARHT